MTGWGLKKRVRVWEDQEVKGGKAVWGRGAKQGEEREAEQGHEGSVKG